MQKNTNANRVMEFRNHFKNGASLKSLMSKGNQNVKAEIMNFKTICLIIVFGTICSLGSLYGQERRVIGSVTATVILHYDDNRSTWEQKVRSELMRVASNKYENAVGVQNLSWTAGQGYHHQHTSNQGGWCTPYYATAEVIGVGDAQEATKKCPYCSEKILSTAKKCKHCGEWLDRK